MMFKDTIAVYCDNHIRYINIHLPSHTKCDVTFPNNELCHLNNENVRQTQTEVMKFIVYLMRT